MGFFKDFARNRRNADAHVYVLGFLHPDVIPDMTDAMRGREMFGFGCTGLDVHNFAKRYTLSMSSEFKRKHLPDVVMGTLMRNLWGPAAETLIGLQYSTHASQGSIAEATKLCACRIIEYAATEFENDDILSVHLSDVGDVAVEIFNNRSLRHHLIPLGNAVDLTNRIRLMRPSR